MVVDIQELTLSHVADLAILHSLASHGYSQYFTPFPFDVPTFYRLLHTKRRDRYYVILVRRQVAGFYMLRGLDEGYAAPMYGVWIAEAYSGCGLALNTLRHAVLVCIELECHALLLKVHPNNVRAKSIYERFGFDKIGMDSNSQNIVYRLSVRSANS